MRQTPILASRYRVLGLLGEGGMSVVYAGEDTVTGEQVAIKLLKPEIVGSNPNMVERFAREGEVLRRLNHPNIVKMLAAFEEDGQNYVVMERVTGGDLAELLKERGSLSIERVLDIALDLTDALTRAHRLNIIHRDIKPANVLMAEDGTPRLTDFGVARLGDATSVTKSGTLVGTIAYLSPEGCMGEPLDARADIWSFGVMLYEMLTGYRPFMDANTAALITAILTRPVPPLEKLRPNCPPGLINLIYRMLEKDRDKRISTARQVGAWLEATIDGRDVEDLQNISETDLPPVVLTPSETDLEQTAAPPPFQAMQQAVEDFKSARSTPSPESQAASVIPAPANVWHPVTRRVLDRTPRIFISYRRGDSAAVAGRLYDRLAAAFGQDNVFKDVNNIPAGANFKETVENAVINCDVLLVVIGQAWNVIATRGGTPRLEHEDDFVRLEVTTGLSRDNVLVIPVLVNGAAMPTDLPDKLEELRYRNAATVRNDPDFNRDTALLIDQINSSFHIEKPVQTPRVSRAPIFLGFIAVLVLAALVALLVLPRIGGGFQAAAVDPVQSGEHMLLVAQLEGIRGAQDDVSRFIVDDLRRKFEQEAIFSSIRVRAYPGVITTAAQAAQAAELNKAPLIVWGNTDGQITELNFQIGSLEPIGEQPFQRATLESVANASVRLTNPREQSIVSSVIAGFNVLASAVPDAYILGANLATLELVNPNPPEIIGNSAAARYHRLLAYWISDTERGLAEIEEAIRLNSQNPILFSARALSKLRLGRITDAALDMGTAQELAPADWPASDVMFGQTALLINNDPAASIPYFDDALAERPDDWMTLTFRGAAHYMVGNYEQADADISRAITFDPKFNAPYSFAALNALRAGRVQEAQNLIKTVKSSNPDPAIGERLMSGVYNIGKSDSPLVALVSAFGNYTLEQWPQVINDSNLGLAKTDRIPGFWLLKGLAECNLNRHDEAEASYTRMIEADPDFAVVYMLRAQMRNAQGNTPGMLADMAAAAETPVGQQLAVLAPAALSGEINCKNLLQVDLSKYNLSEQ